MKARPAAPAAAALLATATMAAAGNPEPPRLEPRIAPETIRAQTVPSGQDIVVPLTALVLFGAALSTAN